MSKKMMTATLLVLVAGVTYLYFSKKKSKPAKTYPQGELSYDGDYMNADANERRARREKRRQWRRDEKESRRQESEAWDAVLKRYFK